MNIKVKIIVRDKATFFRGIGGFRRMDITGNSLFKIDL